MDHKGEVEERRGFGDTVLGCQNIIKRVKENPTTSILPKTKPAVVEARMFLETCPEYIDSCESRTTRSVGKGGAIELSCGSRRCSAGG